MLRKARSRRRGYRRDTASSLRSSEAPGVNGLWGLLPEDDIPLAVLSTAALTAALAAVTAHGKDRYNSLAKR